MEEISFSALSKDSIINKARSPAEQQEHEWVNAGRKGNVAAFNELVLKWEGPIYNLCLRMLKQPEEAAEATQEVFLSAFKSISKFRRDAQFSTWLYRIAANHCISRLRKQPSHQAISLDDSDEGVEVSKSLLSTHSQEEDVLKAESQQKLLIALELLTPDQKIIIELKFFNDQTFEEISNILDTPLSTIKSRMYQALDVLKVHLGQPTRPVELPRATARKS